MESLISDMLQIMMGGGPNAIIAILVMIIALLLWERKRLIASIDNKDAKIERIIDDYYRGNLTLAETLTSLREALHEIRSRL